MIKKVSFFLMFLTPMVCFSQNTIPELLKKHNSSSVPYITVQELAMPKTNAVILDARELKEFETSHIKDAIFVGFTDFNIEKVTEKIFNKNEQIVVYCSLGIRSEDIAERIKNAGFTNVLNLFGGIFEWKNNNFPIYDKEGYETEKVHAFSQEWSQWLKNGIKIYE